MVGQQAIPLAILRGSVRGRGVLIGASGTPEIGGLPVAITFSCQGDGNGNGNGMTGSGSETVGGGQDPFVFEAVSGTPSRRMTPQP